MLPAFLLKRSDAKTSAPEKKTMLAIAFCFGHRVSESSRFLSGP